MCVCLCMLCDGLVASPSQGTHKGTGVHLFGLWEPTGAPARLEKKMHTPESILTPQLGIKPRTFML